MQIIHPHHHHLVLLKLATGFVFGSFIFVDSFMQFGLFGNYTDNQISKLHPTLLSMPVWAYLIWGLIFLFQLDLVIATFLPFLGDDRDNLVHQTNVYMISVWLLEIGWVFAFGYHSIWLSEAFMLSILGVNAISLFKVQQLYNPHSDFKEKVLFFIWEGAIALNFSWILFEAAANTAILFSYIGVSLPSFIAAIQIGLITALAATVATIYQCFPITIAQIWGCIALASKHSDNSIVAITALICAGLEFGILFVIAFQRSKHPRRLDGYRVLNN